MNINQYTTISGSASSSGNQPVLSSEQQKKSEDSQSYVQKRQASYQKYFSGYEVFKAPKRNGKGYKLKRIYVAPYQAHKMDNRDWVKLKIHLAVVLIFIIISYILPNVLQLPFNTSTTVAVFSMTALFSLVFSVSAVVFYIRCPRLMTNWEFSRSTTQVRRWPVISCFCLLAYAISVFIYSFVDAQGKIIPELFCSLCILICSALNGYISYIERKLVYYEEPNDAKIPFYEDMSDADN